MTSRLDAVIVPAGRGWPHYAQQLAADAGARLFAVGPVPLGLPFTALAGEELRAGNDIAWRRREGIRDAARAGARTALLLDDDITGVTAAGIEWGLRQLAAGAEAAAFPVTAFPDNSSVFHAWRAGGREPGVQPSGAALLVRIDAALREEWRWTPVYNEDWLFLAGLKVARSPFPVVQEPYDPWAAGRAASQEAGEVLAYGLCGGLMSTDPEFWRSQLRRRADLLAHVHGLRLPAAARASVSEAREACAALRPSQLAARACAWRAGADGRAA